MEYAYLGYTEDRRIIKGRVTATSEQAAMDMLTNVGYSVVSLKSVARFLPDLGKLFQGKAKPAEMVTFSRQLALLLESGVGVVQSLELLQLQTGDKQLKKVLIDVVSDIRSGDSLSASMAKHPHVFPTIYHKMVAVGEQTGGLETVLRNLADHIARQSATVGKLKRAMMYPVIVLCVAIVVMAIMITVVLPPIIGMFESLGGELPMTTRALLAGYDFLINYGLYLLAAIIGLGIAVFMYSRSQAGRYNLDVLLLKLPVVGRLSLVTELARCCRSMSLLFKSGLPLPDVMTLTAEASGNRVVAKALGEVEHDMLKGEGLSGPMRRRRVFLPLMVEMTKVGEEVGSLDVTLITVAENYEIVAENQTQLLISLIEPAMTVGMGLMVGFIALAVFMPMYGSLGLVGG